MPNTLRLYAEDPDGFLAAGNTNYGPGSLIRAQWSATSTGVFADVGTAALVSATRSYVLYHVAGTSTTWYRTRYENSAGTNVSDWTPVFQVGGEEGGYLCSLADVRQRLGLAATDTTSDEDLAEFISQVTTDILGHTGREFIGSAADETRTFDAVHSGDVLYIPGGIRSITTLSLASSDQPDTAGTYTATTNYYLRPLPHDRTQGWPATRVELGIGSYFYPGRSTVSIVGKFGWAAVPPDIAGIATNAVVRRFQARQSSSTGVDLTVGSADMGFRTLAFLSPAERAKLEWYAVRNDG